MLPTNHAESRKAGTHARHQRVGRGWLLSLLEHSSPMADGSGWVTTFTRSSTEKSVRGIWRLILRSTAGFTGQE